MSYSADISESFAHVYRQLKYKKDDVKKLFQLLDTDRDSCLSREEFDMLLKRNNIYLQDYMFDTFFNEHSINNKVSYSYLYTMVNQHTQNENNASNSSMLNLEDDSMPSIQRLGAISSRSAHGINPYNHSLPQNTSYIDHSFLEDGQPFTTTVIRSGHMSRATHKQTESSAELSSLTHDLLTYDFRPNVECIHKNVLISSFIPIQENIIQTIVTNIQQELLHVATLRHFTVYRVTDTSNENRCVLSFVWRPVLGEQSLSLMVERAFGKDAWKELCTKYCSGYRIRCDTMVDIHPNYCNDKFLVY